ncbi:methyl-CpG-binding domain-containing protein 9-like isoform X2 [Castanea sativa]
MEDRRDDISNMNAIVDSTKGDPVLVLNFVPKLVDNETGGCSSAEAKNKMGDINECARENPKAPSDEGVCKLCGVNKDDKKVLLCDKCDSGYHTYCLNPPLAKIPHGNWYCPSCVTGNCFSQGPSQSTEVISRFRKKRCQREFNHRFPKALAHLVTTMAMKEYWEYTVEERILLLKFLCDEVLNSAKIREHLEQCASMSADLQQKLHSLSSEWRNLKFREEVVADQVGKVNQSTLNGVGKSVTEEVAIVRTSYHKLMGQLLSGSSCMSPFSTNMNTLEDGLWWPVPNDSSKQPCWLYSKSSSEKHSTSSGSQIVKMHDVEFQKNQLSFGKNGLGRLEWVPNPFAFP